MSCLGVHFALSAADVTALEALADEADRLAYLQEQLEERYFAESRSYVAESDKAWDAMHRALSDGHLGWSGGSYPLNHTVLGGKSLYAGDDYIMSLKSPSQVRDVAAALARITREEFRRRYDLINAKEYGAVLCDEDFEYTWAWLQGVLALYQRASVEGRHVLFTADQ